MLEFFNTITPDNALRTINSFAVTPTIESVNLENASQRVLAEDFLSQEMVPSFPRSLVDGFAFKAKDGYGAKETNPVVLNLAGTVPMGKLSSITVEDGKCVYVSTGSMVPRGADAVIMQEYTRRNNNIVEITKAARKGENIFLPGEDTRPGQQIIKKGKRLSPFNIGTLASLGTTHINVFKKPRVGLISSGDELVAIDVKPPPGKIRDINRYTVTALLEKAGGSVEFFGVAKDDKDSLCGLLEKAQYCDLILVSGGSSKGERDVVVDSVTALGGKIIFHGINIKPGKPTIFGTLRGKPFFGLPGHPLSCSIVVIRFVYPLLQSIEGEVYRVVKRREVRAGTNIPSTLGIEEYLCVTLAEQNGILRAHPIYTKSSAISALGLADGYIIIPEGCEGYEKDDILEVFFLE